MSEEQPPKKPPPTLSEFIETNSKLITSLAAFVALTIFAIQQGNKLEFVAAAASLGAVLLAFELFRNLPARPRQWRLDLFELIFLLLAVGMGQFWLSRFKNIWVALLVEALLMVVVLLFCVAITYALLRLVRLFAIHVLRMDINPNPPMPTPRSTWITVFVWLIFFMGIWWWISHRFAGRSFHMPTWLF